MYKNMQKNISKLLLAGVIGVSTLHADPSNDAAIGINLGYAIMPYSHTGNKPDLKFPKSFLNIELYTILEAISENNTYRPSINYIYNTNDQFANHTLLLGLNKFFYYDDKALYLGALAGYGQLDWDKKTINGTINNDLKANSLIGGIQAGVEYYIDDDLSFNINSKFLMHDYAMHIQDTSSYKSDYSHPYTASISVGLKYTFGSNYAKQKTIIKEVIPEPQPQITEIKKVPKPIVAKPVIVKPVIKKKPPMKKIVIPVKPLDSDKDGIIDRYDKCPNTPQGFKVDKKGCVKLYTLNVKFAYKSNEIPSQYDKDIRKLGKFLRTNKAYKAQINAYTDSIGGDKYNAKLSRERARAVYNRLRYYGIAQSRLNYSGRGESSPIASNQTDEGREKNRRVEVLLVKGTQNEK